jgi:glycosyltransferase involved in cell wall biosynthesis
LDRVFPAFAARRHITVLPGWRAPAAHGAAQPGARRAALRDCSVVIPTVKREAEVARLLEAIGALPDTPAEVVIVDADPAHELGPQLLSWRAGRSVPFALAYVESPPGLTRQRNVGIDISTRDFIFFLDPEIVPLPGYFAEIRRVFGVDRDQCVGGVAGVVINEMSPQLRRRSRVRRAIGLLPRREPLIYDPSGGHTPRTFLNPFSGLRRVDILPGCACAWRREVFASHRFSCYFHEEADGEHIEMSLRAGRSWTLLCAGDARVRRDPGPERPAGYDAGRARLRNRYFIWKRHARPARRHVARFWITAVAGAAIEVLSFCLRPTRAAALRNAAGILVGALSCLTDPPHFAEPPARREYALEIETRRRVAQGV